MRKILLLAPLAAAVAAVQAAPRPKLVVLVVAEQFRPEYLERYRASFTAGGFERLLKGGAVFRECRYDYLATYPASGAAVLATGAWPERHGIVAEYWYDSGARRVTGAVDDPVHGASPRHLVGTTLADQLRLATGGRSRAVSISLRAPTAVLLAGRKPTGCYWLDEEGRLTTSSYYAAALPGWASEFRARLPQRHRGWVWKAVDGKDAAPPLRVLDPERKQDAREFVASYLASPPAMEDEFDLARAAVEAEHLGSGTAPDLLALSLSTLYFLGLETGSDSPLMRDLVLRLDRKLAEFFGALDTALGAGNVWVVFTATQGLAESPEKLQAEGIGGGRVVGEEVAAAVNAGLSAAFGRDNYVEKYVYPFLYLRRGRTGAEMLRVAGEAALAAAGVAGWYAPGATGAQPERSALFARCLYPERSGGLLIAYQPYYMERHGDGRGVTPGSFYSYDTRVPLVLYGPAFRAQTFHAPVSPTDLAPTLAAALDIAPPSSATGRPLVEAFPER